MRKARIIFEGFEAFYHVSNEIKTGLPYFTENQQAEMDSLIFDAASFCHIKIKAYTVYPQGYGMLVKIPAPYDVSDDVLAKQVKSYFGAQQDLIFKRLRSNHEPDEFNELNKRTRDKLFNLREFVMLFSRRFSASYNKQHHRQGSVWKQRFRSNVVENNSEYLMNAINYIHTRPIVTNGNTELSSLKCSSWTKALEGNQKWRKSYTLNLNVHNWGLVKRKMDSGFNSMTNRKNIPDFGSVDQSLIEKCRSKSRLLPESLQKREQRWQMMYSQLKKYVMKNGHFLFPRNTEKYGALLKWTRGQRSYYKRGSLSQKHIHALDQIDFPWDVNNNILKNVKIKEESQSRAWKEKYELLKVCFKKKGDLLPPYNNRTVSQWISYQRIKRKKNLLSEMQIKLLDAIGMPWEVVGK